jgi:hypothetical protein
VSFRIKTINGFEEVQWQSRIAGRAVTTPKEDAGGEDDEEIAQRGH